MIRRLNKEFSLGIPEETKFYYYQAAGKRSDGWVFQFWFRHNSQYYGGTESITNILKYKKLGLYNGTNETEIVNFEVI